MTDLPRENTVENRHCFRQLVKSQYYIILYYILYPILYLVIFKCNTSEYVNSK